MVTRILRGRRLVWPVMALLLVAPLIGWAAGEGEGTATEEVTEITWMSQFTDSYAFQDMEERFGVKVVSNGIFENDAEKRELMLAAGEQPDFGNWWGNPVEHYEDGIIRGIPKDWIRKYAPRIAQIYDNYPLAWLTFENPDNPDELLSLNGISYTTDTNLVIPFFRYDRAMEAGLELPNYEQNKMPLDTFGRVYYLEHDMTWGQMEQLLKGYRAVQPGTVEIPLGVCSDAVNWCLGPWLGAFGLAERGNREVDGTLYYWHTDPGMKDFIKAFASWFSEGLIDREFATMKRQKYWEKGAAGLYGVQSEPFTNAGQPYATLRTPNNMVPEAELGQPGAQVVGIPPIVGPSGLRGGRAYSQLAAVGNYNFYASNEVSDAKLIKTLEMLDYYFGTIEGWITFRNGEAGVHFDWEGEPYGSFARNRPESDIPAGAGRGGISVYPVFYTVDRLPIVLPQPLAEFQTNYALPDHGANLHTIRPYRWDFFNETDYTDLTGRYMSTLTTLWQEMFLGGITGQIDVDAEWDSYVQKWNQAGGAEIVAALEKSPIVDSLRDGRREY